MVGHGFDVLSIFGSMSCLHNMEKCLVILPGIIHLFGNDNLPAFSVNWLDFATSRLMLHHNYTSITNSQTIEVMSNIVDSSTRVISTNNKSCLLNPYQSIHIQYGYGEIFFVNKACIQDISYYDE